MAHRYVCFNASIYPVDQQNKTFGMAALLRINTNGYPSGLVYANDDANKALLNTKVLRLSTAATNDGTAVTPALDRSLALIFDASEGALFI